jgi:hypothetical protein
MSLITLAAIAMVGLSVLGLVRLLLRPLGSRAARQGEAPRAPGMESGLQAAFPTAPASGPSSMDVLKSLIDFSKDLHGRIGVYMQSNYSGSPDQLPQALRGLRDHLRDLARQRGIEADDQLLEVAIRTSVTKHRIASSREVNKALEQISSG